MDIHTGGNAAEAGGNDANDGRSEGSCRHSASIRRTFSTGIGQIAVTYMPHYLIYPI